MTSPWSISTTGRSSTTIRRHLYAEGVGYPALMAAAVEAVADVPDGFIALGFSNGAGMAEYVANPTQGGQGGDGGRCALARHDGRRFVATRGAGPDALQRR